MSKTKKKNIPTKENNNKDLIPFETAEEIVTNVLREKNEDDRQSKYFLYRICGLSPKIAARLCGYNEDYGYKLDRRFKKDLNKNAEYEK